MASRDSNLQIVALPVSNTGVIGEYDVSEVTSLRIVTEDAGAGNYITLRGKIKGQASFVNINKFTGNVNAVEFVKSYDILQIECTNYSTTSSFVKLSVSGFYYIVGDEIDDSTTDIDTTWSSQKITDTIVSLGDTYVRSTRFATISSGT